MASISAIGTVLSGAIAKLYHGQVKLYEDRITQLEGNVCELGKASKACQDEHTQTKVELAKLTERLAAIDSHGQTTAKKPQS